MSLRVSRMGSIKSRSSELRANVRSLFFVILLSSISLRQSLYVEMQRPGCLGMVSGIEKR